MDNEKTVLKFDLTSKQIKFKEFLGKEFLEMEVYAISDIDPNRNGSHFTKQSLQRIVETGGAKNKPIVGFFDKGDFTTHEGSAGYDMELQQEYWDTTHGERILGWTRESDRVELVEKDGQTWLKFGCMLCVAYCYQQVKRLLKDKRKKVSVEITVNEFEKREDGVVDILDFTLNGTTILGSKNGKQILEGIPDAHASILSSLDSAVMSEQRKVLSFAYEKIDPEANKDKKGDGTPTPEPNESGEEEEKVMEQNTNLENENLAENAAAENHIDEEACPEGQESACGEDHAASEANAANEDCGEQAGCGQQNNDCGGEPVANEGERPLEMASENPETDGCENPEKEPEAQNDCHDDDEHDDEGEHDDKGEGCDDCGEEHPEEHEPDEEDEMCKMTARIAELEAKCEEYCGTIARMEREACEREEAHKEELCKYSNYEEITSRMEAAEAKVHEYFCADLKREAIAMMSGERINDKDYQEIISKCEKGLYSCEDDIKRDVAYATYNARPATERRFSVSINVPGATTENVNKTMTREQRLASQRAK